MDATDNLIAARDPELAEAIGATTPKRPVSPWWTSLAAGLVSGVLLALSFPPYDLGWLAWIAPVPLFWLVLGEERRPALGAFVGGFVFFLILLAWMRAFSAFGWPLAATLQAAYLALFAAVGRRQARWLPAVALPPLLAAGWVGAEYLREQGVFGFSFGQLAVSQHRYLPVLQTVDLFGPYGLSFLMALLAASVAAALRRAPGSRMWVRVSAVLVAVAVGRGLWLLRPAERAGEQIAVAVVQAHETGASRGPEVHVAPVLDRYQRLSQEAAARGARLIVWPETTLEDGLPRGSYIEREVTDLARRHRVSLVSGLFEDVEGRTANSAMLLNPDGRQGGIYRKVELVPFGEYVPARPLLQWVVALGAPTWDQIAGKEWRPLPLGDQRVGVAICFESAFTHVPRALAQNGATMLVVITSDGWRDRETVALQHEAMAPLRAVETRRSLARAAATGISSLIDPYGRRVRTLPPFVQGQAVANLPFRHDLTLYTRLGDTLPWLCLLATLSSLVLGFRRARGE